MVHRRCASDYVTAGKQEIRLEEILFCGLRKQSDQNDAFVKKIRPKGGQTHFLCQKQYITRTTNHPKFWAKLYFFKLPKVKKIAQWEIIRPIWSPLTQDTLPIGTARVVLPPSYFSIRFMPRFSQKADLDTNENEIFRSRSFFE
jgi:hypothetical protein